MSLLLNQHVWVRLGLHCLKERLTYIPFVVQMGQLWRRDIPLAERLGNGSPVGFAPGPPATAAPQQHNTSWVPEAPVVTPEEPIFLMTATAQTISGFFVWTALLITCHQVRRGGGGGGCGGAHVTSQCAARRSVADAAVLLK